MRISFHVAGYVCVRNGNQTVVDPAILEMVNGWQYTADSLYNYLDAELVDQGIVGGAISATWAPRRGVEIVIDYWVPDSLSEVYVNKLRDQTVIQLSDGIGEGGFDVELGGNEFILIVDLNDALKTRRMYDGTSVSTPSGIARAARDGNMGWLLEAITRGESVDATIQGNSGLHLAIIYGHVDAALLLISQGANTNLLTNEGETPLHLCALSNSLNDADSAMLAKAMLTHKADIGICTPTGDTAISFAKYRKKVQLVVVFEKAVNERTSGTKTPPCGS
jgi:hypothetical protein